jgi:hypothetical protein
MAIDPFGIIDNDCYVKRRIIVVEKVDVCSKSGDFIGRFVYSHNNKKAYYDGTKQEIGVGFSKMLRELIDKGTVKK